MHSKSTLLSVIGLGAGIALSFVYAKRDPSGERVTQEPQPTTASVAASPFAPVVTANEERAESGTQSPAQIPQKRAEADADPADVPTPPENFPTYDENAVQLPQEQPDRSDLTDANARAAAIRDLDTSSPDSFPALEQTLRSDPVARNRLLAVKSLRLLGKQAGNTDRARGALRVAMSDADQNVSTNARDAYDELAR